jgi:hypothetical protein
MIKIILLTSLTILNTFSSKGQDWHKQNILNLATVEFPNKPEYVDTLGVKAYRYVTDSAIYLIEILDLSKQNGLNFKQDGLQVFYNSVINGIIERSSGNLIRKDSFEISGLKGVEFEMTYTANPSLPNLHFYKIIFNNLNLIIYTFWTYSERRDQTEADRYKFFNSINPNLKESGIKQYTID